MFKGLEQINQDRNYNTLRAGNPVITRLTDKQLELQNDRKHLDELLSAYSQDGKIDADIINNLKYLFIFELSIKKFKISSILEEQLTSI